MVTCLDSLDHLCVTNIWLILRFQTPVVLKIPAGTCRAVARTLIGGGGGGGCIFIYSGSARVASFEINFISKETSLAEPEYMNIHPPPPPPN